MLEKLPSNIQAEKAILGSMLVLKDAAIEAASGLDEDDFVDGRNKILFVIMVNLLNSNQEINLENITNELINQKALEKAGGVDYLRELRELIITPSNYKNFIDLVKEQAILRRYLLKLDAVLEQYKKKEIHDTTDFIGSTAEEIRRLSEKRKISDFESAETVANRVQEELNIMKESEINGVTGLTTGYDSINKMTHGWQKSDMIVVAARPSVGKTALGLNFCLHAAIKGKKPVAFFSLEMPATQLMRRLVAAQSCVDLGKIQTGCLSQKDYLAIERGLKEISNTKLFIDETNGNTMADILAKSRKLKNEHPDLGMIMIDYLGLIASSSSKRYESRQLEVQEYSHAVKALARELQIPVIVISQLNRGVDKTKSQKPQLSDLRESGSIEQDADIVILLHRDDYQNTNRDNAHDQVPAEGNQIINEDGTTSSIMDIIIAKNRNGQTGEVQLVFSKNICRFDEKARDYEDD